MRILTIAYYTILRNIRDVKSLMNMMLLPIVLILILGTALSSAFEPDNISKTPAALLNLDTGEAGRQFDAFINNEEIQKLLDVKRVETYEEGTQLVNERKVTALIVLKEGFTQAAGRGDAAFIEIYKNKFSGFSATIVENVVDGFINGANTAQALYQMKGSPGNFERTETIEEHPISASGRMPGALDYYAVTVLVVALMHGAIYGVYGFAEDYLEDIGMRIKSAPIRTYEHYIGKSLGTIFTVFWQSIVIILFSKFVYHANWGTDMVSVLLVSITLSVLSTGLGIMMCILTQNPQSAAGVLNLLINVFALLSGGYVRFVTDNPIFNGIRHLIPNHLAHVAIFNSIYGGAASKTYLYIGLLWIMILVLFGVSMLLGRRRVH